MIGIGRDERCIQRERMSRDGGIEILDPRPAAFQGCLDAAERLADGIGPLGLETRWLLSASREARLCRLDYLGF